MGRRTSCSSSVLSSGRTKEPAFPKCGVILLIARQYSRNIREEQGLTQTGSLHGSNNQTTCPGRISVPVWTWAAQPWRDPCQVELASAGSRSEIYSPLIQSLSEQPHQPEGTDRKLHVTLPNLQKCNYFHAQRLTQNLCVFANSLLTVNFFVCFIRFWILRLQNHIL